MRLDEVTLQKLDVLVRIVRLGGVGRAADDLFVVQPAVSAHIRSLKELTGQELFSRQGRRMELTRAGRLTYHWAEDVLARTRLCEQQLEELADARAGRALVAADVVCGLYVLPPIIAGFGRECPAAELRLVVVDPGEALARVRSGTVDLAVVMGELAGLTDGLEVEELSTEELVLVVSPRIEAEPPASPDRVASAASALEIADAESRKRAVLAGAGSALLPRSAVAADLASGALVLHPSSGTRHRAVTSLVRLPQAPPSPLQRLLVEEIRTSVAADHRRRALSAV